jgi:hypothetical protein
MNIKNHEAMPAVDRIWDDVSFPKAEKEGFAAVSRAPTEVELAELDRAAGKSFSDRAESAGYHIYISQPHPGSDLSGQVPSYLVLIENRCVRFNVDREDNKDVIYMAFSYTDDYTAMLRGDVHLYNNEKWDRNFTAVGETLDASTIPFFRSLGQFTQLFDCKITASVMDSRRFHMYELLLKKSGITNIELHDHSNR